MNSELAADIYLYKKNLTSPNSSESDFQSMRKIKIESVKLARKLGLSARTIRDVWNHKAWIKATRHLWDEAVDSGFHLVSQSILKFVETEIKVSCC